MPPCCLNDRLTILLGQTLQMVRHQRKIAAQNGAAFAIVTCACGLARLLAQKPGIVFAIDCVEQCSVRCAYQRGNWGDTRGLLLVGLLDLFIQWASVGCVTEEAFN